MIKAVIFDMDGLIVDTEKLSAKGWIKAGENQNAKITLNETLQILGFTRKSIYEFWQKFFQNQNVNIDKLMQDHYDYLEKILFNEGPKKMPYVEKLLIYLTENNYKIAVASSSDTYHIENNLEKTNLKKYFNALASGEEVKNGKPNPDIFLLAAKKLNVKPEECLVLEDSKNGIIAAKKAGMRAIMVPDMFKVDDELKILSDKIVKNLKEVINYLEEKK